MLATVSFLFGTLDNFRDNELVNQSFSDETYGLFHVDRITLERTPKLSAEYLGRVGASRVVS